MAERIELAFRRAASELIRPELPLLVAVSGGGDSIALLHLCDRLGPHRRPRVVVAHLDHALRRGSATDRRFVERTARTLGYECLAERRPVERRRGESPEEASRRVRREFLLETAKRSGCGRIATGHTLDDQAETILMRLVRGAGAGALAGIRHRGPGPFVRPLLGTERAELRAWLERQGIEYRDDPSNRDTAFDRNRVRHRVMPLLAEHLNPRVARRMVDAADRLREDADYLDLAAEDAFSRIVRTGRDGALRIVARELAALARPLGRRVAHVALRRAGADARRVTARHVDALLMLADGGGRELDLPNRLHARRIRGTIVLFRPLA